MTDRHYGIGPHSFKEKRETPSCLWTIEATAINWLKPTEIYRFSPIGFNPILAGKAIFMGLNANKMMKL